MSKLVKILLALILVVCLALAAMILVPRLVFGIDIFDLSGWNTTDEGYVQYLDYRGTPLTGWQTIEKNTYYFDPDNGAMATGWLELEGSRYYLDESGIRQSGWVNLEDGSYFLDPETAAAASGWLQLEEGTYYVTNLGRKLTGWQDIDSNRYYLGSDGLLHTGWLELDGERYFLREDGVMATGWLETPEGRRYLDENGVLRSGWTDTPEGRFYLTEEGLIATGWIETEEGTLYLDENGQPYSGWLDLEKGRYYLTETGLVTTGWLELEGKTYYFREDGIMAIGKVIIDEIAHYFSSTGDHVYLVNAWNPVPDDYEVELVAYKDSKVAKECYDATVAMFKELDKIGYYKITSSYRSKATQQYIWDKRLNQYKQTMSKADAEAKVAKEVAVPGTSEHHLGLALDISAGETVDNWLAENSWRYGFIMRYPDGKTHITGIIYEPWHYRYVGLELAKELYDSGLTLEEYMDMLTEKAGSDAGTASNPENQ